ncbi:MAG: HAD family hydrolase [Chloroflexi bacterium]|nr:MAG: HAD family hydrolase [Chloroflexota bacterium]
MLKSPNGINVILFDLDGTLRHSRPSSEHAFFDFAVQLGAKDSPKRRLEAMRWLHHYWAQSPLMIQDQVTFQDDEEGFWTNFTRRYLIKFGCSEEKAKEIAGPVRKLMDEQYKPEDVVLPGTLETLGELKEAGFRLGIVTNRTNPCDDYLQTLGLTDYFEITVVAGSIASWKPDPRIFEHTLETMKADPEAAIYVGDNYYADIIGARRAGIQPVLIDPEGVFPDPGCPVISKISELEEVLK